MEGTYWMNECTHDLEPENQIEDRSSSGFEVFTYLGTSKLDRNDEAYRSGFSIYRPTVSKRDMVRTTSGCGNLK